MKDLYQFKISDLAYWAERIEKLAEKMGIDFYPQEFEIIDYRTMLERKTYNGMLSFYPSWSSGKKYEIDSILYNIGQQYLPYEMVIATDPCIACLRDDNDLAMQILTMAHVYGHNNFFKNNIYFKKYVEPKKVLDFFRSSAETIRSFEDDPSIGPVAVRKCIDAAQALRWQCAEVSASSGGQDLLVFLRDNSPRHIHSWEKYIIDVVMTAFNYLYKASVKTQGMNEGWATYCHYKIMNSLDLPPELRGSFARHHSKVVRLPDDPRTYNHYLVNFEIWNSIEKTFRLNASRSSATERMPDQLFEIMSSEDDLGFLQKYLTIETAREVGLFSRRAMNNNIVVDIVIGDDNNMRNFEEVKQALIAEIDISRFGGIPIITAEAVRHGENTRLYLKHDCQDHHLEATYASKTLEHAYYFWGEPVALETKTYNRHLPFLYKFDGKIHSRNRKR